MEPPDAADPATPHKQQQQQSRQQQQELQDARLQIDCSAAYTSYVAQLLNDAPPEVRQRVLCMTADDWVQVFRYDYDVLTTLLDLALEAYTQEEQEQQQQQQQQVPAPAAAAAAPTEGVSLQPVPIKQEPENFLSPVSLPDTAAAAFVSCSSPPPPWEQQLLQWPRGSQAGTFQLPAICSSLMCSVSASKTLSPPCFATADFSVS
jgi:hypothetical protein